MIVVLDEQDARRQLDAGRLACSSCGGRLRLWGHARARQVRQPGGQRSWLRPRRARCAGCGATHVLLPAAAGLGHWPIASSLGVPADTVRGWLRRARRRAEWLRVQATGLAYQADPSLGAIPPRRSALADAVEALGQAAAALTRRLGGPGGVAVAGHRRVHRRAAACPAAQRLSISARPGVTHAQRRQGEDDGGTTLTINRPRSSSPSVPPSSSSSVSRNTPDDRKR